MSPKKPEPHYIEGAFRLDFPAGAKVCRFECSDFYAHRAQNFCTSCKEMDYVLYLPKTRELWLIELKDYRFNARPRVDDLADKLCRKVRDSLFVLQIAATCAPDEHPDEGISLREMGRLAGQALRIRLAFGIELMGDPAIVGNILMNIHDVLKRQLHFIDPDLLCLPISRSSGLGPWRVSAAKGELSAKDMRRKIMSEKAHQKHHAQQHHAQQDTSKSKKKPLSRKAQHRALPRWKQRAIERAHGYSGTHVDRDRFLDELSLS